jgi:multiple sugar transport system permease protein
MLDLTSPRAKIIFATTFTVLAFFLFFPLFWMISTSLKSAGEIFVRFPTLLPVEPTLKHYVAAVTQSDLPTYLKNSLITAGGGALLTVVLATGAAYSFAKFDYFGRRALMLVMISAQMFPFAVLLITLYPMFQAVGLLNTHVGLTLSYIVFALPTGTYMLYSYFTAIPSELIEAARVDGASEWTILYKVILPISIPGLVTVGLYAFMWGWNDLLYSLTLVTSPGLRTVGPGLLLSHLGEMRTDWGAAMAASFVASLPVVLAFAAVQRFFIQGITAGAVKS